MQSMCSVFQQQPKENQGISAFVNNDLEGVGIRCIVASLVKALKGNQKAQLLPSSTDLPYNGPELYHSLQLKLSSNSVPPRVSPGSVSLCGVGLCLHECEKECACVQMFLRFVEEKTWSRHLSISCTSLPSRPFCSHSSQWGRCGQAPQFLWFNRVNKTQKMEQNWTVEAQDKKKEKYHLSLFTDLFISLHKCPSLFSGLSTIHDSYICYVWWLSYSSTSAA